MVNIKSLVFHLKFIRKKPLITLKIISGFFFALILRRPVLRTIDLAVTYNCHYMCEYCSAKNMNRPGSSAITVDQAVKLLNEASKLGRIHTNFTGGEPMMRSVNELCEIIKRTNPRSHLYSLVTNSLNVTKEKLLLLKDAGLDTIQLSFESLDPAENDRIRGIPGSFDKTMEVLKWSKELGLNVCLSTVVTHLNINNIDKLLDFSKEQGCFLLLNKASSTGKWSDKKIMKMNEKDRLLFERLLTIPNTRSDISFNFRGFSGCPGGIERVYITAYGDAMMCPHVQISYGNMIKEGVGMVWKRMCSMNHLNYKSVTCKHAFDGEFYDTYIKPIEGVNELPVDYRKHPVFKN